MRHYEARRPDQVPRNPQQHLALCKGLGNKPELVLLEVAQAAVDQFRRG